MSPIGREPAVVAKYGLKVGEQSWRTRICLLVKLGSVVIEAKDPLGVL
jgi:hypothetical protein